MAARTMHSRLVPGATAEKRVRVESHLRAATLMPSVCCANMPTAYNWREHSMGLV